MSKYRAIRAKSVEGDSQNKIDQLVLEVTSDMAGKLVEAALDIAKSADGLPLVVGMLAGNAVAKTALVLTASKAVPPGNLVPVLDMVVSTLREVLVAADRGYEAMDEAVECGDPDCEACAHRKAAREEKKKRWAEMDAMAVEAVRQAEENGDTITSLMKEAGDQEEVLSMLKDDLGELMGGAPAVGRGMTVDELREMDVGKMGRA